METLATRTFTMADQQRFAERSGDYNPIHIDSVAARRTLAGQCIVHGTHAVLWALDELKQTPSHLKVKFLKPVHVDETVTLLRDNNRLFIMAGDIKLVDIAFEAGADLPAFNVQTPMPAAEPNVLTIGQMAGRSGELPLTGSSALAADLMALSRLVGMECPGLQSMFSAFDVAIASSARTTLTYAVTDVDERFSRITIDVTGVCISGTLDAFVRPAPAAVADMKAIAAQVNPGEFAGQRALVIGGSRGLGEVTAKILAAGGAHVTITYAASVDDANRVAAVIRDHGGACDVMQYTVPGNVSQLPAATQVYYFATPKIFGKRGTGEDAQRLAAFRAMYVQGFEDIFRAQKSAVFFYPSSIAIEQPLAELAEYITAKTEGEALCSTLSTTTILISRLPRTATDQTQALVAAPAADPLAVMLPLVRDMQTRISVLQSAPETRTA
ncbi:MAG: MaoC/PaaZ C-terminal domain-containing protein [Bdellovibrionales bacterium]